jgi:hypothetical protein
MITPVYTILFLIILSLYSIKHTYAKDVLIKFDEYIRKIGSSNVFEEDDIVNIISFELPRITHIKIQDLNKPPEFYDSFVIHSGIEYNSEYYFESGSFEYHIYDQSTDKLCIKRCIKEGMHYGAIAIMNYRSQLLGDSVLCSGIFLHAI